MGIAIFFYIFILALASLKMHFFFKPMYSPKLYDENLYDLYQNFYYLLHVQLELDVLRPEADLTRVLYLF